MFYRVKTDQDIDQVIDLAWCIWPEHYTSIIGAEQVEYMLNHFHSKAQIAQQINADHYLYFLIKKDSEAVGYIGLKIQADALFLSKIYILASERGTGIGRVAMEHIKNVARQNNLSKISLTVNKYNKNTIKAYCKFGFIKTGELCADIGGGYKMDDFQMELSF
ncbi:MAG: RimJ/RimL family protein N-acetyltransferase [Psychromonas sp.]|jgi:RimJ/RimL family protein N-acetyltransferase|uniref:GNAT family N-acetyltransferase n=1 Tax=Psychromonas sp. TaxID=1884585 RepID=UPI0039E21652